MSFSTNEPNFNILIGFFFQRQVWTRAFISEYIFIWRPSSETRTLIWFHIFRQQSSPSFFSWQWYAFCWLHVLSKCRITVEIDCFSFQMMRLAGWQPGIIINLLQPLKIRLRHILHPLTCMLVWFSTLNYEIRYLTPFNCRIRADNKSLFYNI